ncbi:MAG: hypothetical protein QM796_14680 [Chthoniobacteraceae bacterium]
MHRVAKLESGQFCHGAGRLIHTEPDASPVPSRQDHILFTIDACGPLVLAVNTFSRLNFNAGYEARIHLGMVLGSYETLPESGLSPCAPLDYTTLDQTMAVNYRWTEKVEMETLLLKQGRECIFIEAWGDVFIRQQTGIHQIHSRRSSCAVEQDYHGRDGAIKFYHPDLHFDLLLLKFCGQP